MTEKKFDPKPGDTIVTRSRGNWICSTREEIEKILGDIAYKDYSIFAVNPQHKYSFMCWPDHTGEYPGSTSWSIVEIIPAEKEEQMQEQEESKRHKHADLIIAWANGAVIQCLWPKDEWQDCASNKPSWDEEIQYRIKPEPKPDKVRYGNASVSLGVCNTSDYQDKHDNLKLTFDGETGKLKAAEVI